MKEPIYPKIPKKCYKCGSTKKLKRIISLHICKDCKKQGKKNDRL